MMRCPGATREFTFEKGLQDFGKYDHMQTMKRIKAETNSKAEEVSALSF